MHVSRHVPGVGVLQDSSAATGLGALTIHVTTATLQQAALTAQAYAAAKVRPHEHVCVRETRVC